MDGIKKYFLMQKKKIKILVRHFQKRCRFFEKFGCEAFKISFEITHLPLIEHIAKKKKPILISTEWQQKEKLKKAIVTV